MRLKDFCEQNNISTGEWLWSAKWGDRIIGRGHAAAKKITGFGESCVVLRRPRAMEHVETDAPNDVRIATPEEVAAEKKR